MTERHGPNSIPPATEDIDLEWREELLPTVGADPRPSPFERETVAPPIPPDQLAAELMAEPSSPDDPSGRFRVPPPPSLPAFRQVSPGPEMDPHRHDRATLPGEPPPTAPRVLGIGAALDSLPPAPDPFLVEDLPPTVRRSVAPAPLELDLDLDFEQASETVVPPASGVSDLHLELAFGEGGDALDLAARQSSTAIETKDDSPVAEVRDRFAVGDFSGALVVAEAILETDPAHGEAKRYAESCRDVLKQMYVSRLGGTGAVPEVAVPQEQIRWLSLDHKSGFLLSLIDGMSRIEEILDVSGMPELDALRLLFELHQQHVIRVE